MSSQPAAAADPDEDLPPASSSDDEGSADCSDAAAEQQTRAGSSQGEDVNTPGTVHYSASVAADLSLVSLSAWAVKPIWV